MLEAEFLNLEGGGQDRVKILHRSVLDVVYIRKEDSYKRQFNVGHYLESCDYIKIFYKTIVRS